MAGSLTSSFCILLDPGKQLSTSRQLNYALISALKWKCAFLWLFNNFYYLRFAPFQTPVVVAAAIVSMTALTSFTNSVVIPEAHAATNLTLHRTLKVDCAFFFVQLKVGNYSKLKIILGISLSIRDIGKRKTFKKISKEDRKCFKINTKFRFRNTDCDS